MLCKLDSLVCKQSLQLVIGKPDLCISVESEPLKLGYKAPLCNRRARKTIESKRFAREPTKEASRDWGGVLRLRHTTPISEWISRMSKLDGQNQPGSGLEP
jgi:hypothetical protein